MFTLSIKYNGGMEKNEDKCKTCGRPWLPLPPACNYCDSCLNECHGCTLGRIKEGADPCENKCCVIPAITVETIDGITNLANCFVHVTSINTTFYIDDKHRPMIIWAGAVEVTGYDVVSNPLGLRSQECYNLVDGKEQLVYFDKQGVGHIIGQEV